MSIFRWPKPVRFEIEFGPNYLWHLFAVARIAYDSEYADTYRDTIDRSDLEFLALCRPHLVWGENEGGSLAGFFTTLPAWLNLRESPQFQRYFDALGRVLRDGTLQPLVQEFGEANWGDRFIREYVNQANFAHEMVSLLPTADRVSAIFLRNLKTYRDTVWPKARGCLEPRAASLQNEFAREDYIARWEALLQASFATDAFRIILCYASKNGPDYNSLGYDRLLLHYDKPFSRTCQFISHEIGTHMLNEHYIALLNEERYDRRALFMAYETLAMFYNRLVLGVDGLDYALPHFDEARHLAIYESAYHKGIHPRALLERALSTD